MKRRLLMTLLLVLVSLCMTGAAASNCALVQKCGLCVDEPGCGWCDLGGKTGECKDGTETGPLDPDSCSTGLWKFSDCANEDKCVWAQNCTECSKQQGCGWCDTHCVAGNDTAPATNITCYNWSTTSCTINCSKIQDCQVCTSVDICDWCTDTGTPGQPQCSNVTEVIQNPEICASGVWASDPDSCPASIPCSSFQDCQSCIASPSESCGWCKTTGQCQNTSLPASACDELQLYSCSESCYDFTDCQNCTQRNGCGWCATDAKCYLLNGTDYCPFWIDGNTGLCPDCSNFTDCTTCLVNECWWCQGKTEVGIFKGTCGSTDNKLEMCYNTTCPTPTPSPSLTPSAPPTISLTPTISTTPSLSASPTASINPSATIVNSITASSSPSRTHFPTRSSTSSASIAPTASPSTSATTVPSSNPTASPDGTPSPTASETSSKTPSISRSVTISSSRTSDPTPFPSSTQTPSVTGTKSVSATATGTKAMSLSSTPTPSPSRSSSGGLGDLSPSSITFISLSGAFCAFLFIAFAVYLFYHRYWRRKHYFEVLR